MLLYFCDCSDFKVSVAVNSTVNSELRNRGFRLIVIIVYNVRTETIMGDLKCGQISQDIIDKIENVGNTIVYYDILPGTILSIDVPLNKKNKPIKAMVFTNLNSHKECSPLELEVENNRVEEINVDCYGMSKSDKDAL